MPITHTIPSSKRRPFTYHEFDDTSKARGLVPITQRVALLGTKSSAGTQVVAVPVQVFDEGQADTLFGKGSELALMCRKAFEQARREGASPEIWAVAIAEPGGGTAAVETLTVTGTATEGGDVVIEVAGRSIRAGVTKGDVQNTIAAALEKALDAAAEDLPVTASVATNVVTCTHVTKGVNGNDVDFVVVKTPGGVTVTPAQSVAGAGTVDITASLDVLIDKDYHAVAIANHTATDVTDFQAHFDAQWAPGVKRWRFGYLAETGTLSTGTTLATTSNDKRIVVLSAENCPGLPGEIAAAVAVAVESQERPNTNWNRHELAIPPAPSADIYTDAEVETVLAAGATPITCNGQRTRAQIERLVTTKTTQSGGAPFEALLDLGTPRTQAYLARQVEAALATPQFQNAVKSARVLKRIRSVIYNLLRAAEKLEYVQNVEAHAGELVVETDVVVPTRAVVSIPESIVPILNQVICVHTLFVE